MAIFYSCITFVLSAVLVDILLRIAEKNFPQRTTDQNEEVPPPLTTIDDDKSWLF